MPIDPKANINPETGIPYGVIHGRDVPDLVEEIMTHGKNITYELWKADLIDSVKWLLKNINYPNAIDEAIAIVDNLDNLGECFDNEECEYTLMRGEGDTLEHYLLSYLGGATLVWVQRSPWITQACQCSPCVPNAGDLNTLSPGGFDCYDISPEDRAAIHD